MCEFAPLSSSYTTGNWTYLGFGLLGGWNRPCEHVTFDFSWPFFYRQNINQLTGKANQRMKIILTYLHIWDFLNHGLTVADVKQWMSGVFFVFFLQNGKHTHTLASLAWFPLSPPEFEGVQQCGRKESQEGAGHKKKGEEWKEEEKKEGRGGQHGRDVW